MRAIHASGTPRARTAGRVGTAWAGAALGITALAGLLALGGLVTVQPLAAAITAALVLAIGVAFVQPAAIPLVLLPLIVVVARVGGGGVNLSVSDVALAAAFVPAVALGPRPYARSLRILLWLALSYQVATLLTVINNPYTANIVEWFHTWMLVSGSLIVGWVIGRSGYARLGLVLLMTAILILALITIVQGIRQMMSGNYAPVYTSWPFMMHKNFVGTVCSIGATIAYARPQWLGWRKGRAWTVFTILTVAILFTQSRQALIGLVAAIAVLVLRPGQRRRRSKAILLLVVPALVAVTNLVQDQVQSGNQFNSVFQRLTWFQDSYAIWLSDPWFGAGLRWWYTDRFGVGFQPPNAEVEVATSAGLVGLAAFLLLIIGAFVVLRRLDTEWVLVAVAVLANRLVQAQFDLYWSAVQGSLPWLLIGLCVGGLAHSSEEVPRSGFDPPRPTEADREERAPANLEVDV